MAHFAELDNNNLVLRVIVISNKDVDANGGDESTQAETFVATIVPHGTSGVAWKQTSYNNNFKKQYAGIGYSYDSSKDKFINSQPYLSWGLDFNDDWQSPITYPNVVEMSGSPMKISWNEENLIWEGVVFNFPSDTKNYSWDDVNLQWNEV